jgi:predicted enzyme related to lactoylglutathione lyase
MTTYSEPKPAGTPTWIDITAPDVEAARAFYQKVFGWEYEIGEPEYGGYTTARLGQRSVAGLIGPMPGAPPMPAAWSLYFATDDIAADVARATALGATVMFPAMAVGEYGSMAICTDPIGAAFGFWQAGTHIGSQVTEEAGSPAWYELYSSDAKQARDFYTALLNATADAMPGDMEYFVLKHGDKELGGIMQIDPAWGDFHPQWVTYFSVANVDETVGVIKAHGGKIMGNIDDSPFGRLAAVADPGGAAFKVIEPPKG